VIRRPRGSAAWPISRAKSVAAEEGTVRPLPAAARSSSRPASASDDITLRFPLEPVPPPPLWWLLRWMRWACCPLHHPGPQAQRQHHLVSSAISPEDQRSPGSAGPNSWRKTPSQLSERVNAWLPPSLRSSPPESSLRSWPNGQVSPRPNTAEYERRHQRSSALKTIARPSSPGDRNESLPFAALRSAILPPRVAWLRTPPDLHLFDSPSLRLSK